MEISCLACLEVEETRLRRGTPAVLAVVEGVTHTALACMDGYLAVTCGFDVSWRRLPDTALLRRDQCVARNAHGEEVIKNARDP